MAELVDAGDLKVFHEARAAYLTARIQVEGRNPTSYKHLRTTWSVFDKRRLESIGWREIAEVASRTAKERQWKPATLLQSLNCLSGLFRWCADRGYVKDNPVRRVPKPSSRRVMQENERKLALSPDQVNLLLRRLNHVPEVQDMVRFAVVSGLRWGEVEQVTADSIHRDSRGRLLLEVRQKQGDYRRLVLKGELRALVERKLRSAREEGRNRLFPVRYHVIRRELPLAAENLGFTWGNSRWGFTPHTLRRTLASNLVAKGVTIRELMGYMGWRSVEVAMRYVQDLDDERVAAVADGLFES